MLDSQQKEQNSAPAGPDAVPESDGDEIQVTASRNGAPEDPPSAETEVEMDPVQAELERLRSEKAELLDRFQRAQAEFENLRKRLMREKDEAREYAAMGTIRSLLPVADDFERALAAPGLDPEVRKGLDLVYKALFEVFTRAGLKPVEEEGEFDPNVHEAVDRGPAESDEDDQKIMEVYQRGYHFKERLLRPAMVKVAVKE
jgi:molecular chaperone GrpE